MASEPNWAEIHRELKRKHVTLTMLWDEYIAVVFRCPFALSCVVQAVVTKGEMSRLLADARIAGGD